jgi:hypothetical protein
MVYVREITLMKSRRLARHLVALFRAPGGHRVFLYNSPYIFGPKPPFYVHFGECHRFPETETLPAQPDSAVNSNGCHHDRVLAQSQHEQSRP